MTMHPDLARTAPAPMQRLTLGAAPERKPDGLRFVVSVSGSARQGCLGLQTNGFARLTVHLI